LAELESHHKEQDFDIEAFGRNSMQSFGHQVSNLRKGSFNGFSVVILQPSLIKLVFSFGVFLACGQDIYAWLVLILLM
jgi:hypothetical protein